MVEVFKTNVQNHIDISLLKPHINKLLKSSAWNFDLDDCDKIFRVELNKNISSEIMFLFHDYGFECRILEG